MNKLEREIEYADIKVNANVYFLEMLSNPSNCLSSCIKLCVGVEAIACVKITRRR